MALTNWYCDPDWTGTENGTLSEPYSSLQAVFDNKTHDTTNGTQINCKEAVSADVLSATLDMTTNYTTSGNPSASAPLVIRGYTSAANDGGIGTLDGNNGNFAILDSDTDNIDYIMFRDMKVGNTGTAFSLDMNNQSGAINCEFHDCTYVGGRDYATFLGCHLDDTSGINTNNGAVVIGNYIDASSSTTLGTYSLGHWSVFAFNTVIYRNTAGSYAIRAQGSHGSSVFCNNVYAPNGSTAAGIYIYGGTALQTVWGNVIEGFGTGVEREYCLLEGNQAFYDCTTNRSSTNPPRISLPDVELTASGWDKSGSMTFANRKVYFNPKSTLADVGMGHLNWYYGAMQPFST